MDGCASALKSVDELVLCRTMMRAIVYVVDQVALFVKYRWCSVRVHELLPIVENISAIKDKIGIDGSDRAYFAVVDFFRKVN